MADTTMTTADGIPLKVSLRKALMRQKMRALLLVAPLFFFLVITFVMPILDMLFRSVDNSIVPDILPRTVLALEDWDPDVAKVPPEAAFEAMVKDIQVGYEEKTIGRVGRRLNYENPGMSSLFRKSGRRAKNIDAAPYKDALIAIDDRWGDSETWRVIKKLSPKYTASYFLQAMDMQETVDGEITWQPEEYQVYLNLFWRTLIMSGIITIATIVLGYPVAYLLATLPLRTSNLLMILVLLPFWTSLLVRTTSWIALLQTQGVLNDLFVFLGIVDDENRLQMIHNQFGTIVAMTHILLPFMILPLYSVMKTIPPSYMRAARSMGANPALAFVRVYMPNTVSGVGAGSILVFILAIGYYITPALVGGRTGTFISNYIATYISGASQNWGLAAALGIILLALVLVLYLLYDKIVGIDNMKLG